MLRKIKKIIDRLRYYYYRGVTWPEQCEDLHKIKTTIYEKVEQLNDEILLQMAEEAITAYGNTPSTDIIDELTPEQQQRLQDSIKQADTNPTIPHNKVNQKAKEWLYV